MSDISLLDLLPRPPSLVPHHISRRVLSIFLPVVGPCVVLVILCFPIVFNVAVRVVRVVCQLSSCLEHTVLAHACASSQNIGPHLGAHVAVCPRFLLVVQWPVSFFHAVSSFTLALVFRRDLVTAFERSHPAALMRERHLKKSLSARTEAQGGRFPPGGFFSAAQIASFAMAGLNVWCPMTAVVHHILRDTEPLGSRISLLLWRRLGAPSKCDHQCSLPPPRCSERLFLRTQELEKPGLHMTVVARFWICFGARSQ